jgi:hypothetical protein
MNIAGKVLVATEVLITIAMEMPFKRLGVIIPVEKRHCPIGQILGRACREQCDSVAAILDGLIDHGVLAVSQSNFDKVKHVGFNELSHQLISYGRSVKKADPLSIETLTVSSELSVVLAQIDSDSRFSIAAPVDTLFVPFDII